MEPRNKIVCDCNCLNHSLSKNHMREWELLIMMGNAAAPLEGIWMQKRSFGVYALLDAIDHLSIQTPKAVGRVSRGHVQCQWPKKKQVTTSRHDHQVTSQWDAEGSSWSYVSWYNCQGTCDWCLPICMAYWSPRGLEMQGSGPNWCKCRSHFPMHLLRSLQASKKTLRFDSNSTGGRNHGVTMVTVIIKIENPRKWLVYSLY